MGHERILAVELETRRDAVYVDCPWCGETVEFLIDLGGGDSQDYVEDCEVCCRPWQVSVMLDPAGGISVTADPSE